LDFSFNKINFQQTFILCTQPRRISAISLAQRVAWERGGPVGIFLFLLEKIFSI
jgi:HrpA-like RNA helicase